MAQIRAEAGDWAHSAPLTYSDVILAEKRRGRCTSQRAKSSAHCLDSPSPFQVLTIHFPPRLSLMHAWGWQLKSRKADGIM
jgi:hypothetical protein